MQATTKVYSTHCDHGFRQCRCHPCVFGDISSTSKDLILGDYHALDGSAAKVLLDFTAVEYINSSGIAIIIQMLLEAGKSGAHAFGIFGLSPHFQKVFTMVGINKYAALYPDESMAMAAL